MLQGSPGGPWFASLRPGALTAARIPPGPSRERLHPGFLDSGCSLSRGTQAAPASRRDSSSPPHRHVRYAAVLLLHTDRQASVLYRIRAPSPAHYPHTASDNNSVLPDEGQPRDSPARIAGVRRDNRHTRQTEGLQRGSPSASGVGPAVAETRAFCPGSIVRAYQARGRLLSGVTYG